MSLLDERATVIHQGSGEQRKEGYVVYWASQSMRPSDNAALAFAIQKAKKLNQALLAVYTIVHRFPEGVMAHPEERAKCVSFMLNGLKGMKEGLAKLNIPMLNYKGIYAKHLPKLFHQLHHENNGSITVVTENSLHQIGNSWKKAVLDKVCQTSLKDHLTVYSVDSLNALPSSQFEKLVEDMHNQKKSQDGEALKTLCKTWNGRFPCIGEVSDEDFVATVSKYMKQPELNVEKYEADCQTAAWKLFDGQAEFHELDNGIADALAFTGNPAGEYHNGRTPGAAFAEENVQKFIEEELADWNPAAHDSILPRDFYGSQHFGHISHRRVIELLLPHVAKNPTQVRRIVMKNIHPFVPDYIVYLRSSEQDGTRTYNIRWTIYSYDQKKIQGTKRGAYLSEGNVAQHWRVHPKHSTEQAVRQAYHAACDAVNGKNWLDGWQLQKGANNDQEAFWTIPADSKTCSHDDVAGVLAEYMRKIGFSIS